MMSLLPIYAVAFVLMFVLARWYVLLPGAVLAAGLVLWLFSGMQTANGPGAIGIALVGLPMALGFVAGFIARAIVLARAPARQSLRSTVAIGIVSFIAAPAIAYAIMTVTEERRRRYYAPPSAQCLARAQRAELAGVPLAIPLAPWISMGDGPTFDPGGAYILSINEHARRLCADAAVAPVSLTHLTIDFQQPNPAASFCRAGPPYAWRAAACRRYDDLSPSRWPLEVSFYQIGAYDAGRMLAYSVDKPGFAADDPRLRARRPNDGVVGFDEPHDRYRALAKAARGTGPAVVAACFDTTMPGERREPGLACRAAVEVERGVGAVYEFRTTDAEFGQRFREADAGMRAIWSSLRRR